MYRIAICDDDTLYTDYLEHKIKEARDFSEKYTIYRRIRVRVRIWFGIFRYADGKDRRYYGCSKA